MKTKLILCFLAAVMVFSMIAPANTFAATSGTFDIICESSSVKPGESFTVTVAGKNIRNMYAFEVSLTFDDNILEFDVKDDISSNVLGNPVKKIDKNVEEDKIIFAIAKGVNQPPENGNVTLCELKFTGKAEGKARVTLKTVKLMDEILKATDYSVNKTIEVTIGSGVSSSSTPPPPSSPTPPPNFIPVQEPGPSPTPIKTIDIIPDLVPFDKATGIARVDLGEKAADIFSGKGISVVSMPPVTGAKAYTLGIPAGSLSGTLGGGLLNFSTRIGSITIPGDMLEGVSEAKGKDIGITIGSGDKSGLSSDLKKVIGERPLVQLTLTLDGKQTEWKNPDAPVMVSIPYTPTAKELKDPEHIVVWYIDGKGKAVSVPNGRYDPKTGMVTFTTTHFSYYAIVNVYKTFSDLGGVPSAKKYIELMVSKGIMSGTKANTFSPALNITRADFLSLLVKTLGLSAKVKGNYDDVKPSDNNYEAVGIAKKLGITAGVVNNRFRPKENISRQDMIVMTAIALEKFKGLKALKDTSVLGKFTDKKDITGYAVGSVATLVKEGLVTGSGKKLNPCAKVTRAEVAVFLYKIYKYQ